MTLGRYIFTSLLIVVLAIGFGSIDCSDADSQSGSENTSIILDGMVFEIHSDGTATLSDLKSDCPNEIVIPGHVTWEGVTYEVTALGVFSIYHERIESISIPAEVRKVEYGAISSPILKHIEVDPSNQHLTAVDDVLYNKEMTVLIYYAPGKANTEFEVPSTVMDIGNGAFSDACNLVKVVLPDDLIAIRERTFSGCISLKDVHSYSDTSGLPENVIQIGESAFNSCDSLEHIGLPNGLTMICSGAFSDCHSLKTICLSYAVSYIDTGAFSGCKSLMSFEVDENNTTFKQRDGVLYSVTGNGSSSTTVATLVSYPCAKADRVFQIPNDVVNISWGAFDQTVYLEEIVIPDTLTYIDVGAFYECTSLVKVQIPDTILNVGRMAFFGCINLTEIVGGKGILIIEEMAFYGCGFKEFRLHDSVRVVNEYAFATCPELSKVTIPVSVTQLKCYVFVGCHALESITFEGNSTKLDSDSLSVGDGTGRASITVIANQGFSLPDDSHNEYTTIELTILGEEPYPYENLIGIAICLLVLYMIIRLFRKV